MKDKTPPPHITVPLHEKLTREQPFYSHLGVTLDGFIVYTSREVPFRDQQPLKQDGYPVKWVNIGRVRPH